MQNEVPEAVNRAVAAEARNHGATVVLNAAPMRPMAPALMRLVDLLIVNPRRGRRAVCDADPDRRGRARGGGTGSGRRCRRADHHPGRRRPSSNRDRGGRVRHHATRRVPVVSAHGAGDVFVGALCARIAARAAMEDAIACAQDAAARYVSTPVGDRGLSFALAPGSHDNDGAAQSADVAARRPSGAP